MSIHLAASEEHRYEHHLIMLCGPACKRAHHWSRYVPLGLRSWFTASGVKTVVELDWWQSARHPGTKIDVTFTPAQVRVSAPACLPPAAQG
jgi:hypothetical protein